LAEEATEQIIIDFEELPVVASIDDAFPKGAPRLPPVRGKLRRRER
jgi:hypothetical protein